MGIANHIFTSIIIPTLNRAESLAKTLESLKLQKTRYTFEINIVDNGSTDKTSVISKEFIRNHKDLNIRYFYESSPGLLAARHRGANESRGEILIYIDDDVDLKPGWLDAVCTCFRQNSSVALAGGKSLPIYEVSPPDWTRALWSNTTGGKMCTYFSLIDLGNTAKQVNPRYIFGLNYAIRKSVLFKYGGFNPEIYPKYLQKYQGDGETGLSDKIISAHLQAEYIPDATVFHRIPKSRLTKKYIYLRAFSQGVSDSYTHLRHGRSRDLTNFNLFALIYNYLKKIYFSSEEKKFLSAINREYLKGYTFHQKHARSDFKLLDWIKKRDYFDYSLPL